MPRLKVAETRRAKAPTLPGDIVSGLVEMFADPVLFGRAAFGHDYWRLQREIMRSVWKNRWTSAKACHASGKTYMAADIGLAWLATNEDGIVISTAPTWTQVEKLLWGEVHKSLGDAKEVGRIAFPEANLTELTVRTNVNYFKGYSTNEGVRFQGWHGNILLILDEAPGVRPDIYGAIEGIRAGGKVHVLELGNPILPSGPFYESHTKFRHRRATFTISAFDVPNLVDCCLDDGSGRFWGNRKGRNILEMSEEDLEDNVRPYLTTRAWVREKFEDWGPDNPLWESKVLGQFPTQDEFSLIPLAWVERARELKPDPSDSRVRVGIDVAGPGEAETTLTVTKGPNLLLQKGWTKPDPRGEVLRELAPFKPHLMGERGGMVNVDDVGIGYYFMLGIRDAGMNVRGINVGLPSRYPERFANLKAELYWGLRDRFKEDGVGGLVHEKTQGQLAGMRWGTTPRGQVAIMSKVEMMKKLKMASPDYAESTMLAYAPDIPLDSMDPTEYEGVRR
jgi:phage terminase large subunit